MCFILKKSLNKTLNCWCFLVIQRRKWEVRPDKLKWQLPIGLHRFLPTFIFSLLRDAIIFSEQEPVRKSYWQTDFPLPLGCHSKISWIPMPGYSTMWKQYCISVQHSLLKQRQLTANFQNLVITWKKCDGEENALPSSFAMNLMIRVILYRLDFLHTWWRAVSISGG